MTIKYLDPEGNLKVAQRLRKLVSKECFKFFIRNVRCGVCNQGKVP